MVIFINSLFEKNIHVFQLGHKYHQHRQSRTAYKIIISLKTTPLSAYSINNYFFLKSAWVKVKSSATCVPIIYEQI